MAYSTRRKSVNLSLLGIHVPLPRPSQRSPPTSTSTTTTISSHVPELSEEQLSPPAKRLKRSHSDANIPDSIPILPTVNVATNTPPPSPPPADLAPPSEEPKSYPKVDTEGINDDVVCATIEQLERTNNRPHLLKELAIAIAGHVHVVET